MDIAFWLERWNNGEIGFHKEHINPYLGYYYGQQGPAQEKRKDLKVFVPLCGKSRDMWWLSQSGYDTVGVECSEIAVEDFFKEQQLEYDKTETERHVSYSGEQLEILLGDFFSLEKGDLGRITDIYDRASLIALPVDLRRDYVKKITELQDTRTRTLLITLTYPEGKMEGPPFSVSEDEVNELYSENYEITKLAAKNIIEDEQRFKERGLNELVETAYKLKRIK